MATKRKTRKKSSNKMYQAWTHLKLAMTARRLQKRIATLANSPAWKKYQGMTTAQQRKKIQQELTKVSKFLRTKTTSSIDVKLKALKKQIAKRLNVVTSSSKATSPAIKRLTAKRSQVSKAKNVPALVKIAIALKLASFKNPKVARKVKSKVRRAIKRSTTKTKVRRTVSAVKIARTRARINRVKAVASTARYKKLTQTLKKEIQRLKQRNTLMRKLVAKFRTEVNQMQRHYGTLSTAKPRLNVVSSKQVGKDVSNIIRFSNALNSAFPKQRKFG